jgi:hypothetical protein
MQRGFIKLVIYPFVAVLSASCLSKTIKFETDGAADVYKIVGEKKEGVKGQYLGRTPLTVTVEDLTDAQLRFHNISDATLPDQYWYFPEIISKDTRIVLGWDKGLGDVTANVNQQGKTTGTSSPELNVFVRTLMRAYSELSKQNYREASALAEKCVALNGSVAGPYVILAMAKKGLGDNQGAKEALLTSKGLDPQDADLEGLMKSLSL